jgi:ATP-dependent DNA ligase
VSQPGEFVVVGRSDPQGSRHRIGSLLLGYYTPEGELIYAGRPGMGMPDVSVAPRPSARAANRMFSGGRCGRAPKSYSAAANSGGTAI